MSIGTTRWIVAPHGHGFIQPDDGSNDASFDGSALEPVGLGDRREDQKVSDDLTPGKNGKSAAGNLAAID